MNVHLHVLFHGLWGSTKHMDSAVRIFTTRHGISNSNLESRERIQLLLVEANQGSRTYDGVDWGAERAVEEVSDFSTTVVISLLKCLHRFRLQFVRSRKRMMC